MNTMYTVGMWIETPNKKLAVNLARLYSKRLGYKIFAQDSFGNLHD